NNALAMQSLRAEGEVNIRGFDAAIVRTFAEISRDIVAELGSGDDLSRKIFGSYAQFRALAQEWSDVAELPYLGIRGLV
ncbi:MAG TPA: hypothetical protein VN240_06535, partial [Propylenella sp.]|nr:hypothetical protein [Propylenella sp.]